MSISNRQIARQLGVSEKAIRLGIASGRLRECLGKDERGRTVIVDEEKALVEWRANAGKPPKATDSPQRSAESAPDAAESESVVSVPGVFVPAETLVEAQRLNANERARKLKMENDLREGRLVESAVAAREGFNAQRTIRESLLNLPARFAAELAAETDAMRVHIRLDAAIREALQEAAEKILAVSEPLEPAANE